MSKLIEYLEVDEGRNVFVVGDIHGCFEELMVALNAAGFNFENDLCICVGDLVDRGDQSVTCVNLLKEPWLKSVKGNHEDFCIQGFSDYKVEFYHKMEVNGGEWFYQLEEEDRERIANRLVQLPLVIELAYKGKKYGFVHADVAVQDWELFKEMVIQDDEVNGYTVRQRCMRSRDTIREGVPVQIAQVDEVYLGHTVVEKPVKLGNMNFIDTGCVFSDFDPKYHLTVIKL